MSDPVRTLVFGYHNVGHDCLQALIDQKVEVIALITHKDDPREEIWFRSAADLARKNRIPVYTPDDVQHPKFVRWVESMKPDLIFSFYYRHILPAEILKIPRLGALNMHGSYLPKYRGRCPVNWVLVQGETETGVTLHHMVSKADAGDIVGQKRVPIDPLDTARTLMHKMTIAATDLLTELIPLIRTGTAPRIPQDEAKAAYFGGRRPEDGRIDWNLSAGEIHNLIRAVTHPYPGAFTYFEELKVMVWDAIQENTPSNGMPGQILSIVPLRVAAGKGSLEIVSLQAEDENETGAEVFVRKHNVTAGDSFINRKKSVTI